MIVAKNGDSACSPPENQRQFTLSLAAGDKLNFTWHDLFGSSFRVVRGSTSLAANQWHHVALTYDGSISTNNGLDRITLYLNVLPEATALVETLGLLTDIQDGSARLALSGRVSSAGTFCENPGEDTFFKGAIDEVEIFDRTLSAAEIRALFEAGSAGKRKPSGIAPPAGMVSWWPGDGNASDILDGNHGILTGDTTATADGMVGQAFSFGGTGDYVDVPAAGNLDITFSFTLDAWINPESIANSPVILSKFNTVDDRVGLEVLADGSLCGYFGSSCNAQSTGGLIRTGSFTHVAFVFDDTANRLELYVNGLSVQTESETGGPGGVGAGIVIGESAGFAGFAFNGLIDEVELFNRALSAAEIKAIFDAGSAGRRKPSGIAPPAGMVSWWPGDGNASDIVDGNPGTIVGGATFTNGLVGQAFSFDAGLSSGITVPNSANLNPTGAITIGAWVKPSSFPNAFPTVVRKRVIDPQYLISVTDQGQGHCNIGGPGADPVGGVILLNEWTHLACTYDRVAVRLYVNGVEVATTPATQAIPVTSDVLGIGKLDGSTTRNFDGLIDEVEIFNRALSAAEIRAIFEAGSAGKRKP